MFTLKQVDHKEVLLIIMQATAFLHTPICVSTDSFSVDCYYAYHGCPKTKLVHDKVINLRQIVTKNNLNQRIPIPISPTSKDGLDDL